ncbi:MAG: LPS export ABC transporter periplasmic protein LptC [Blastocatellia bacterium]
MTRDRLQIVGRVVAGVVLVATVIGVVYAFLHTRRQARPISSSRREGKMAPELVSRILGYRNVRMRDGREGIRILAAEELSFSDGHHELVKADVTVLGNPVTGETGPKTTRIQANHAAFYPSRSLLTFSDQVVVTTSDGLLVTTEILQFEQETQIASTPVAIQFRQGELDGSAIGARILAETRQVELLSAVWIKSQGRAGEVETARLPSPQRSRLEIRSQRAFYDEQSWQLRFEGQAELVQGERMARAESLLGRLDPQTRRLTRIELRGGASLAAAVDGRATELTAREIDADLDPEERLTRALARGQVRATGRPEGHPHQVDAEQLDLRYVVVGDRSLPRTMVATGAVHLRLEAPERSATTPGPGNGSPGVSLRTLAANQVEILLREDGETFDRATAQGEALLTITPQVVTPTAERTQLRAQQMKVEFAPTGNRIRQFQAQGEALAVADPLAPQSTRSRRTLAAQRLVVDLEEASQQVAETLAEGAVQLTEDDRTATAQRALYSATRETVLLRGRPRVWDSTVQANAEEIDLHLSAEESLLRGRVRTTYFNRQSTGGALPFRQRNAPITVAADQATIRHRAGVAQYLGNARAWQEDEFLRADRLEIDRTEKTLLAVGQAQSAYYQLEREVEPGRKERIPVFASAERIRYLDQQRRTFYEGSVRLRQGVDSLEAATAEALLDADHQLVEILAADRVVLSQPDRLARGERILYRAREETAILTGRPAVLEDRSRQVLTQSEKLTLDMRGATIQASHDGDQRKRVKTSHRIP